jgi:CDP-diacylglycerol pyrophosphatase
MRTTPEHRRRAAPASHRWCRLLVAAGLITPFSGAVSGTAHADPDALWTIVHDRCVPDRQHYGDPAPCAWVNLSSGKQNGYAVLKDIAGTTQYLLIPTARITGIESPAILAPDATNYFAAAWRVRYPVLDFSPHRVISSPSRLTPAHGRHRLIPPDALQINALLDASNNNER